MPSLVVKSAIAGAIALILAGSAVPAHASLMWNFSFSSSGDSAFGMLTTDDLGGGFYQITDATGTYHSASNGDETITGLDATGGLGGNDNALYPTSPLLDVFGFTVAVSGPESAVNFFSSGSPDGIYYDQVLVGGGGSSGTFSIPAVEPASAALLVVGLVALPWFRRRGVHVAIPA